MPHRARKGLIEPSSTIRCSHCARDAGGLGAGTLEGRWPQDSNRSPRPPNVSFYHEKQRFACCVLCVGVSRTPG